MPGRTPLSSAPRSRRSNPSDGSALHGYQFPRQVTGSQHAPAESASESQRKPSIRPTHARACMHAHTGDWFGLWTLGDGRWNNRISRLMISDGRTSCRHAYMLPWRNLIESVQLARLSLHAFSSSSRGTHDFRRHIFAMATLMRAEMSSARLRSVVYGRRPAPVCRPCMLELNTEGERTRRS